MKGFSYKGKFQRRRITILAPGRGAWGGVHKVMANLVQGLVDSGVSVDLLLFKKDEKNYITQIPSEVRVIELQNHSDLLTRSSLLFNLIFSIIPNFADYLRHEPPHAVLTTNIYSTLVALIARKLAISQVRVVATIHTILSYEWIGNSIIKRKLLSPILLGSFFPQLDAAVAVSQGAADDLIKLTGMSRNKVRVIYNPVVTPELFRKAEENVNHPWFTQNKIPVVLGIGGSSKVKDVPTLIRAFNLVRKHRDIRLIILGEVEKRAELKEIIENLSLTDQVDMLGFVKNPYPYMKRSSVFVLSSAWEGLSAVLIEAMALGLPLVATDCPGGPREVLEGGKWGQLVPVGDEEAMASAILNALDSPKRPSKEAWTRFTVEQAVRDYMEVLEVMTK